MRNKILIIGGIAFLAYILGTRASKPRAAKSESVGHQVVRLWNEPKARKSRKKPAKKLAKSGRKNANRVGKAVRGKAHDIKKNLS